MPVPGDCVSAAAAAFEDLPDPIWELRADDLRVVTANRAARAHDVVVGHTLPPGLDRAELVAALHRVLRTGVPARGLGWSRVPGHFLIDVDQVRAADGSVRGVLARARSSAAGRPVLQVVRGDDDDTDPGPPEPVQLPAHMPERVPVLRTVRLAAHHVETPAGVGCGEWFEVLALGHHRVALAAGTVGRQASVAAEAAAASTLRAVLTDCLLAGGSVLEAVERLDEAATRSPGLHGATVTLAVLDTDTGQVEQARCGHLPALPLGPDTGDRPGPLDDEVGGPLGLGAKRPTLRTDHLHPDGLLLLHTGGPDARSTPVDEWLRSLTGTASALWPPAEVADSPSAPDVFCARLVDRLNGRSTLPGLTLVAAARNRRPHPDLAVEVPAAATELAPLRTTLTDWLDRLGVTADALTAVPLVVSELASNVAEHAYPAGEPGAVRVAATVDGPAGLLVSVSDDGRWVEGRRRRPGYGLAVARELAEDLVVQLSEHGTRVEARFPLGRPTVAHRLGRAPLGAAVPGAFEVVEGVDGVPAVRVRGPVDLPVVDDLRSVLLQASGGGTRPLTLDLTGATGLAAAGVRLLYELSRYSDPLPRVVAPVGGVVHGVLTLAGLGLLLDDPV